MTEAVGVLSIILTLSLVFNIGLYLIVLDDSKRMSKKNKLIVTLIERNTASVKAIRQQEEQLIRLKTAIAQYVKEKNEESNRRC